MQSGILPAALSFGSSTLPAAPTPGNGTEPPDGASFSTILEETRKQPASEAALTLVAQTLAPQTPPEQLLAQMPLLQPLSGEVGTASVGPAAVAAPGAEGLATDILDGMAAALGSGSGDGKMASGLFQAQVGPASQGPLSAGSAATTLTESVAGTSANPESGSFTDVGTSPLPATPPQEDAPVQAAEQKAEHSTGPAASTVVKPAAGDQGSRPLDAAQVTAVETASPKAPSQRQVPEDSKVSPTPGETKVTAVKAEPGSSPATAHEASLAAPDKVALAQAHPAEPASVQTSREAVGRPAEIISQVSQAIEVMEKEVVEKTRQPVLRLQLQPEDLGKIDLRLTVRSDGLHVAMNANLSETGALLERYLPELRQALVTAGVHLAGVSIGQGSTQGSGGHPQPWKGRQGSPKAFSISGQEVETISSESEFRYTPTSGYDVRV